MQGAGSFEEHVFYVAPDETDGLPDASAPAAEASEEGGSGDGEATAQGGAPLDAARRQELRGAIREMFEAHGVPNAVVSVTPLLQGEDRESVMRRAANGSFTAARPVPQVDVKVVR
jgi:hypothetical protein